MQMRCLLRERKGFRKGFRVEGAGLVGTAGEWLCHMPQYSSVLTRRAPAHLSAAGLVQCIMRCLNRLLDPTLSDSAAIFVGNLVTSVVNNVRSRVPFP